jgi:exopolysaccharide production protein ExoQ
MTSDNRPHSGPAREFGWPRWVFLLFLTAVFFLNYHDLTNSYHNLSNATGGLENEVDSIAEGVAQGSIVRRIALLSLGIVALVSLARRRARPRLRSRDPLGWLILAFVAWALISPIWAEDLPFTLRRVVVFGILCTAALAVASRLSFRAIILWAFFSTAVYLFAGILAELVFGTFRPFAFGYRFAGTLHPNGQGIECGLLLLSGVAAADLEKRWRALFRAGAFIGFVFLILTASRTSIAAAGPALLIYLASVRPRALGTALAGGLGIIFCSVLLLHNAGLLPGVNTAIQLRRDDPGSVATLHGRVVLWKDLGYYVGQRPVLGYGYCGFWTPAHIRTISDEENWGVPSSHSVYIEYLLGLGTVGLLLYALLFLAGLRRAFLLHRISRSPAFAFCAALMVFYALDGFLECTLMQGSLIMFLCMVVLVRLAFVYRQEAIAMAHTRKTSRPVFWFPHTRGTDF